MNKNMSAPMHTVKIQSKRLLSPKFNRVGQFNRKPYVIGICGGPSSGKSTVANFIKEKLPDAVILNLINFYKPIRGNMRRSRANSYIDDSLKDLEELREEKREIYRNNDFDTPEAIDWDLVNKGV